MYRHFFFALLFVASVSGPSSATLLTEGPVNSSAPTNYPLTDNLGPEFQVSFSKFNPNLGTLNSVELSHRWTGFMAVQVTSGGASGDLTLTNQLRSVGGDILIEANDTNFFASGGAFAFSFTFNNIGVTSIITDPAILAIFTGNGNIDLTQQLVGTLSNFTGPGDIFAGSVQAAWFDSTSIQYDFSPGTTVVVSEPDTRFLVSSAIGMLLIAALWRERNTNSTRFHQRKGASG
ncbi:choice-of-anchor E domain-containing protein [Pelagibius sp. Alg239-R121]|uniref:choice-of-anchor E domain-containing protein n=1 Tax=Pelagibius sp. Alg239-R121 TaxID=2993448 RepID=UPI0024A69C1C|nr:choice-of-anchor E domain-containing protein [Pelagibius sp. Alg239-R121]